MRHRLFGLTGAAVRAVTVLAGPAEAAPRCRNTGSFEAWFAAFKKDAESQGISRQAISAALDGVTFDPAIIRRDSGQGVFQQSFIQFASRMTAAGRYQNGLKQLKANAALLSRIEQIKQPVLILHGTSDKMAPPEVGQAYVAAIPDSHLMLVYDAAHEVDADRPEAVVELIEDFCERHGGFLVNIRSGLVNA